MCVTISTLKPQTTQEKHLSSFLCQRVYEDISILPWKTVSLDALTLSTKIDYVFLLHNITVSLLMLIIEVPRVLLPRTSTTTARSSTPQTMEIVTKQKQMSWSTAVHQWLTSSSTSFANVRQNESEMTLTVRWTASHLSTRMCALENPVHCSPQGRYSRVTTQEFTRSTKMWEIIICSKWSGKNLQRGKKRFIERQVVSLRFKDSTSSLMEQVCVVQQL